MKGLIELGEGFDGKEDDGSEKEEGSRGGRLGNLGILSFKRGFAIIVESEEEEENREE